MGRQNDTMGTITIVGGGLAGLSAAIACAEGGAPVRLLEAHEALGGRARSTGGRYKANLGPHVIYKDGDFWEWLQERDLLPPFARPPLSGVRFRWQGAARRIPPLAAAPSVLRLRGREAPIDVDFRSWVAAHSDERTAEMLSAAAGVYTFHHDPGALSAAFVWRHTVRVLLSPPPTARYLIGGWGALVSSLEAGARRLGVSIETGHEAESVPEAPAIVATELAHARQLLGEDSLDWPSGPTPSASTSACATSAGIPSSSPTSTRRAGSSASAHPIRRSPPRARSWSRGKCRSAPVRTPKGPRCVSSACSTSRCPNGASARPGADDRR